MRDIKLMYKRRTESVYYFGEYLYQGALMIANKCQVVFARNRLQCLQVNLRVPTASATKLGQRGVHASSDHLAPKRPYTTVSGGTGAQMKALREITNSFDHSWRFSMALHFAVLIDQVPKPEEQQIADVDNFFFFSFSFFFCKFLKPKDSLVCILFVGFLSRSQTSNIERVSHRRNPPF